MGECIAIWSRCLLLITKFDSDMVGHPVQFIFTLWATIVKNKFGLLWSISNHFWTWSPPSVPKCNRLCPILSAVHGQARTRSTHRHCLLRLPISTELDNSFQKGRSLICYEETRQAETRSDESGEYLVINFYWLVATMSRRYDGWSCFGRGCTRCK